SHPTILYTLLS
nr:Chain C, nuclear receptor subfamily 0, group B, member 2 [Rattus norvegicus]1ZH7_D Chain D, nuclear receptor subfamily 0, group B, member 2 [Rattus norvegicus]